MALANKRTTDRPLGSTRDGRGMQPMGFSLKEGHRNGGSAGQIDHELPHTWGV